MDLMNAKPSSARARARAEMEPQVLGLNGAAPVTPPGTNTIIQASQKANARPIAFKNGGAVNQKETAVKLARGGRPHSAKQDSKPTKKFAAGGAAKVRRGMASESGAIKQAVPRNKAGRGGIM